MPRTTLEEQLHDYDVTREVANDARKTRAELRQLDKRIEELEVAVRAALSFIQNRHQDSQDGHAILVIAALRGALAGRIRD